ncbi:MAG: hypothetical protein ACLP01_12640 [Solirubrobacteraceae bacterium]
MPTLSELLAQEYPDDSGIANSWRDRLADPDLQRSAFLAAEGHPALAAERILGVGVTQLSVPFSASRLGPAILVQFSAPLVVRVLPGDQISYTGARTATRDEVEALARVRSQLAGYLEWSPDELALIALPAPLPQITPGDAAHSTGGQGTFGARIWTKSGARGISTAGHVAPTLSAGVYDASLSQIGTVSDTVDCNAVGARIATADIAAIELGRGVQDSPGHAPVPTGPGTLRVWDTVTAYGAKTTGLSSAVSVALATFAGPTLTTGDYGEAAITMYPISTAGDSGAQVYNHHGALVGHIVAGYPGVYSVMQDITYQLAAVAATLR